VQDLCNREIGQRLNLSHRTISNHLYRAASSDPSGGDRVSQAWCASPFAEFAIVLKLRRASSGGARNAGLGDRGSP
jgi:hypothetical protein